MYAFGAFGDSNKLLVHEQDSIFRLNKAEILDDLSTLTKFYLNFEKYFTKNIELERIEQRTFVNLYNLDELYLRCKSFDQDVFYGLSKLKVLKLNYYSDEPKSTPNKFTNSNLLSLNNAAQLVNQAASTSCNNKTNTNNNDVVSTTLASSKSWSLFLEFKHLNSLRILELSHANIGTLKEGSFRDLVNLELLILYRCSINKIEPKAFENLSNLKKLDMQHNSIETLSQNVFDGLEGKQSYNFF
jgi:hypothetical protein